MKTKENMTKNLWCFSHSEFDLECEQRGWSDENLPPDVAFISIVGSKECQEYYLGEEETHYFSQSSPTVLNLGFDDIPRDSIVWKGHTFYGLNMEQAREIVEFIKNNIGKDFWIHFRAGQSRSQGIVRYVLDCYPDIVWKTRIDNPCETPNIDVVAKLKRIYWEDVLESDQNKV